MPAVWLCVERRRAIITTLALAVLLAPRDVHACWDGWMASASSMSVAHAEREGGSSWSTGRARSLATMLARLRIVTPQDQELRVTPWGDVTFCPLDTITARFADLYSALLVGSRST